MSDCFKERPEPTQTLVPSYVSPGWCKICCTCKEEEDNSGGETKLPVVDYLYILDPTTNEEKIVADVYLELNKENLSRITIVPRYDGGVGGFLLVNNSRLKNATAINFLDYIKSYNNNGMNLLYDGEFVTVNTELNFPELTPVETPTLEGGMQYDIPVILSPNSEGANLMIYPIEYQSSEGTSQQAFPQALALGQQASFIINF